MEAEARIGPRSLGDGSLAGVRGGRTGELISADGHARFYEPTYRGGVYSDGMGLTSISGAAFTTGTLTASCTPITGVWNPSNSTVNLVILQALLGVTVTAGTATGGGPFVWASSVGNAALTLGNTPLNRKSLAKSGSSAKGLSGIALTGLTNNLVVQLASALQGGLIKNVSSVETAIGQNIAQGGVSVENLDGSIIVPPGAVLALLATTTPVAHSAVSGLVWEEVAV